LFTLFCGASYADENPSNFLEQMSASPCSSRVVAKVDKKITRQGWIPVMVSEPKKHLAYGIEFRDTSQHKAYKIWTNQNIMSYQVTDLQNGKQTLDTWDSSLDCRVQTITRTESFSKERAGYTDKDLQNTLEAHPWGIIYVWSPYMPYSMLALKEIKKATAAKGGHLEILLDPMANPKDTKEAVDKGLVKKGELKPATSRELWSRGEKLHYPIAYLYKDRFLSNREYVGYKKEKTYEEWITAELANLKKERE
jgi:hypothetical protein